MLKAIGSVIKAARQRRAFSVADAAARASVSPLTLDSLEKGLAPVTTAQLARIAQVLELDSVELLMGREKKLPATSVFLRHQGHQDYSEKDATAAERAIEAGRQLVQVGALLGLRSGVRQTAGFKRGLATTKPAHDGYALAQQLRRKTNLQSNPIGDLRKFAEEVLEVAVLVLQTSPSVTALAVADGATNACAIVLSSFERERHENPLLNRVRIAHELCHVLFDPLLAGVHLVIDVVETSDAPGARAEQRARAFAAEFLLPSAGLRTLLGKPGGVQSIAEAQRLAVMAREHFRTPWEIAVNHIGNLGYFHPSLLTELKRRPAGTVEDDSSLPNPGKPSIEVLRRLKSAWEAGIVTDGQARKSAGLPMSEPLPWL